MTSSARDRVEALLDQFSTAAHPAYVGLYPTDARAAADAADARARRGDTLGPVDGRIIPVKDLFDVAGDVTCAGAGFRRSAAPAREDAEIVQRLRRAGAIILGRTHMSEFAFSGLGLNASFPTPGNALDPARIPGGSSSGAAVATALGLADGAIGTDTGGSCRIPAALNGLVGLKTSHARVPVAGCFALAQSLDSIGPLAQSVADCAALFDVLLDKTPGPAPESNALGLRLGVLKGAFLEDADPTIVAAYEDALHKIEAAGATLIDLSADLEWSAMLSAFPAPLVTIEAAAVHFTDIQSRRADFDPRIAARIELGMQTSAAAYIRGLAERRALIAAFAETLSTVDAALYPTVPIIAPEIAALEASDAAYTRANLLMLRNPSFGNLFDLAALSLPLRLSDRASAGLTIAGAHGSDERLLAIGAVLETVL